MHLAPYSKRKEEIVVYIDFYTYVKKIMYTYTMRSRYNQQIMKIINYA